MLISFTSRHYYFFEKLIIVEKQLCKLNCFYGEVSHTLKILYKKILYLKNLKNNPSLRAGITYPIINDTYITDLYFSVYCIYYFEPENFFCK